MPLTDADNAANWQAPTPTLLPGKKANLIKYSVIITSVRGVEYFLYILYFCLPTTVNILFISILPGK